MDADTLLTEKMVELLRSMPQGKRRRGGVNVNSSDFIGWNLLHRARQHLRDEAAEATPNTAATAAPVPPAPSTAST